MAELLARLTETTIPIRNFSTRPTVPFWHCAGADPAVTLFRFELMTLRLLGHLPSLDDCAECGAEVPSAARVPFGLIAGGILCELSGRKEANRLTHVPPSWLERCQLADPAGESLPATARRVQGELRGLLSRYLTHLVGQPLEMHRYLSPQDARRPAAVSY